MSPPLPVARIEVSGDGVIAIVEGRERFFDSTNYPDPEAAARRWLARIKKPPHRDTGGEANPNTGGNSD